MRTSGWAFAVVGLLTAAGIVVACGANSNEGMFGSSGAGGTAQGGSAGSLQGGGAGTAGTGGNPLFDATILDVTMPEGVAPEENCAAQTQTGEVWPLDMYIMMDQSGSMSNPFGMSITKTKWQAVTDGLTTFFTAQPDTSDLGVGIQFFPLYLKPWSTFVSCPNGDECSSSTVCMTSGSNSSCMATCQTQADCPNGDECFPVGSSTSICSNDTCDPAAYAKPEVPIEALANSKAAVLAAMKAHAPNNLTPTGPALEGALTYAKTHAESHPDRKVIVVLATDGQPADCPADNQPAAGVTKAKQLAAQALAGNPSVKTFVIGVIDTGDLQGAAACKNIAIAGGTEALILKQNQPLAQQFSDALDKIKGKAVGCEFKIPSGDVDAGQVDTTKVNVVYTVEGGPEETVYAVPTQADCDNDLGGWYYDDPANPSTIVLCPATCTQVQTPSQKITVSIQLGCQTHFMPPK